MSCSEMIVPVRVAVDTRRRTVCSPPGVRNADMGVKLECRIWLRLLNELLQLLNLAHLFECVDLILLVAVDCNASGIVATVL